MTEINRDTAKYIRNQKELLPELLLEKHFENKPELKEKYSGKQISHYLEDTRFHLSYLAEAIESNEQVLFNEYLAWAKAFFKNLPVPDEDIIFNLKLLRDTLTENTSPESAKLISKFIETGIEHYTQFDNFIQSFIKEDNPLAESAKNYLNFLIYGNKMSAQQLIMDLVSNGVSIKQIYTDVFQVTQRETGRLWQLSQISVAQEHLITAATQLIMSLLYPYLFSKLNKGKKIIVACIEGEMHEIGARMVADFFEMEGWDSYYIGANTPKKSLISSILNFKPNVIAISTTMIYNIPNVRELISEIRSINELKGLKIIVGGYPFSLTANLWKDVGADGCGCDGKNAIYLAEQLL